MKNLFNLEESDQKFVEIACDAEQRERTILKLTGARGMMLPFWCVVSALLFVVLFLELAIGKRPYSDHSTTFFVLALLAVKTTFFVLALLAVNMTTMDLQIKFLKTLSALEKMQQKNEISETDAQPRRAD